MGKKYSGIKYLIFVSLLASTAQAKVQYLDGTIDIKEPETFFRLPTCGLSLNNINYRKHRIQYVEASLGKKFPLLTAQNNKLSIQLSASGGAWVSLGYKDGAFPLLTEDFLISLPLSIKYENWSAYVAFNHISAHLGDGFEDLLERDPPKNVDDVIDDTNKNIKDYGYTAKASDKEPFSYSRDFMSAFLMYDYALWSLYFTAGYAHKIIPEDLERWYVGGGIRIGQDYGHLSPYFSQDLRYNADTDRVDYTGQLGAWIGSRSRVYAGIFVGKDRRGQLLGRWSEIYTIGVAFE